ncbi:AraC-like DNA-binding protein [Arcticibacter tournemirensis]|uniref:Helix-turn-helix transcriptional regulator n=1 Tax=Arcticibacter tournemirensis TaxID=699437 RepID=A0A5M9H657_9SPHI|nr:AraC family transcriptional regulator [Arcticibacter tournemirensis]KAA8482422.1 helix-turn-helix transcriptional regulator [Arcticibacter tournemirensis]TQM51693.1 AraC-like DNA-binding protein [Arcticibacter tournemirensis]
MKIEIKSKDGLGMLAAFAREVGSVVENGRVEVPEKFGTGYIQGFNFDERLRMMIRNYELHQDFAISRRNQPSNMLIFNFQHIINTTKTPSGSKLQPSVQITTQGLNAELFVPKNTVQNSIAMVIDASYLRKLIGTRVDHPVVNTILDNEQPLLFEEFVVAPLLKVVDDIVTAKVPLLLHDFYYKLKTQELICQLLIELVSRDEKKVYGLHIADIRMLYQVKERLLQNMEEAPSVAELTEFSGMSETKLKRLFNQVFGRSIFQYFQNFRMQEAARLLKEERLSVSEVGYQLGFSNLGHFAKVFEEVIGVKPKQYSKLTNNR